MRETRTDTGDCVAYTAAGPDGDGIPVVLLHAVGLDRRVWGEWLPVLTDDDRRVLAIDLPGHGESDAPAGGISLSAMADAVAAVIAAESASSAHLVGVSMGGMVAQTLAIEHPALVASLTLVCTMGTIPDSVRPIIRQRGADARAGGMAAVTEPTIERWISPAGRSSAAADLIRSILIADDARVFADCWDAIAGLETLAGLTGVTAPALVVAGGQDVSLPPGSADRLVSALPDARLVTIHDGWHLGAYETPEPFLAPVREFLDHAARRTDAPGADRV